MQTEYGINQENTEIVDNVYIKDLCMYVLLSTVNCAYTLSKQAITLYLLFWMLSNEISTELLWYSIFVKLLVLLAGLVFEFYYKMRNIVFGNNEYVVFSLFGNTVFMYKYKNGKLKTRQLLSKVRGNNRVSWKLNGINTALLLITSLQIIWLVIMNGVLDMNCVHMLGRIQAYICGTLVIALTIDYYVHKLFGKH